ncbi:hypothetical protein [Microbacterium aurantiacum]|uniref:hypothetical protein n=1 Tax=Microbacterium aurantiacum TaxID=162393 RepID=UPI0015E0F923|nr:hypothetical protein [Microbacterium aurantiacum]
MTWSRAERDRRTLGDWSLERRDDEIADLRWRGRSVLRSIRAVVRDRDWNTVPLVVDSVTVHESGLELSVHSGEPAPFSGIVRVAVDDAELVVTMDLRAARDVDTNRTGLVVLHPPQVAGRSLEAQHPDGSRAQTAFPERISAQQPVRDITALAWDGDGVRLDLRFAGDVFEMEDQRNWTDASYKTYSRPLALPFPYAVGAGQRVVQSVRIRATETETGDVPSEQTATISLHPGGPFPAIGVAASSAPDPAPAVDPVGSVLLVEADLAGLDWRAALARAASVGLPLDVRLILDPVAPDKVSDAVAALRGENVVRMSAFHRDGDARHVSDVESIGLLRAALDAKGVRVPVVGGSRSHFTELNRELHRLPHDLDGISVTVTPLFHSVDTEQLVESLAIQRLVAEETVQRAAGKPVHIGPLTLRPRFNDVAAVPQPLSPHADLRDGYGPEFTGVDDARQSAPELAAWTIASAAAFAVPGVASLVWFEEWGPRGIRDTDGTALPVADALRQLADLSARDGAEMLTGPSPDGLVWAIGCRVGDRDDILIANVADRDRSVEVVTSRGSETVCLAPASITRTRLG